jgi:prepilin-type N-terminal cleavage/methylation domain-containing protein
MMNKITKINLCHKRDGFTLTELAIVLAIISVILAGVWSMVQIGWENQRRQQACDEITIVVNNVRGYYSGQSGVPYSANSLATALLPNGTIPGYLQRGAGTILADNPWGSNGGDAQGTFRVCSWAPGTSTACPNGSSTGTVSFFAIELSGLTPSSCIAMSQRLIAPTAPQGLIDVVIVGTGQTDFITSFQTTHVTVAQAQQYCNASGNGNALIFAYKLSLSN